MASGSNPIAPGSDNTAFGSSPKPVSEVQCQIIDNQQCFLEELEAMVQESEAMVLFMVILVSPQPQLDFWIWDFFGFRNGIGSRRTGLGTWA